MTLTRRCRQTVPNEWKRQCTKDMKDISFFGWFHFRLTSNFLEDCSTQQSRILRSLMSLPSFTWKHVQLTIMDFLAGGVFSVTQALTFFIHQIAVHENVQQNIFNVLQKNKDCRDGKLATDPYLKVSEWRVFENSKIYSHDYARLYFLTLFQISSFKRCIQYILQVI